MHADSPPSHGRDAWIAAAILFLLGALWVVLRLYWQGVLLILAAAVLGAITYLWKRRTPPDATGSPTPEDTGAAPKVTASKKTGRKKRR